MLLAAARSVAPGDVDRAADGLEKAEENFQAVKEKSRSLSRFKNGFSRIPSPKSLLFVKCIIPQNFDHQTRAAEQNWRSQIFHPWLPIPAGSFPTRAWHASFLPHKTAKTIKPSGQPMSSEKVSACAKRTASGKQFANSPREFHSHQQAKGEKTNESKI